MTPRLLRNSLALALVASCFLPVAAIQAAASDPGFDAPAYLRAPVTDASPEPPAPIPAAGMTVSPTAGSAGTPLVITGSGFPVGEIVSIYIDAAGPYLPNPPPGPRADAQGAIRVSAKWPAKNYDPAGRVDPT